MLLLRGSVFVHLDPRADGVLVPQWLREQAQLVLQIGLDMPVPIPDLRVDDRGVSGTLSFQRSPFTCSVPWSSVFAIVGDDGRGMVWPTDFPPEIANEVARETARAKFPRRTESGPRFAPGAREETKTVPLPLPGPEPVRAVAQSARGRDRAYRRRTLPPYLRLVK